MFYGLVSTSESPATLAPRALYFWILVSSVAMLAHPFQQPAIWCGVLLMLGGIVLSRRWRPVEASVWLLLRVATAAWALPMLTSAQVLATAIDLIWLCHLADSARRTEIEDAEPSGSDDDSDPASQLPAAKCSSQLPWEGLPIRAAVAAAVFFSGLARINWSYLAEVTAEAHAAGTAASFGLTEDILWKSAAVCLPFIISVGMLRVSSCQFALTTAVLFWTAQIWNGSPDERSLAGICLATVPVFLYPPKWLSLDAWQQPWLAQLAERHVGHAVAAGGLVVATHPLVHWHGLLPPGMSVALWLTLFAALDLLLVVTGQPVGCARLLRLDQAGRWSTWLPSHWLAGALASLCVALVLANGLAPYVGLKTFGTFSEGARLRTEGLRPNHLFMPQIYLLPHQLELAEIIEVSLAKPVVAADPTDPANPAASAPAGPASTDLAPSSPTPFAAAGMGLADPQHALASLAQPDPSQLPADVGPVELKPGEIVPVFELERLSEDQPELTVTFRLCGQLPDVYQLGQASGWRSARSWWQRKLLAFHPVSRESSR